jgi:hypothetical protein
MTDLEIARNHVLPTIEKGRGETGDQKGLTAIIQIRNIGTSKFENYEI